MKQLLEWLNDSFRLQKTMDRGSQLTLTLADIYMYVPFLLVSHKKGFYFEKIISISQMLGNITPSLYLLRTMILNIIAYTASERGTSGN